MPKPDIKPGMEICSWSNPTVLVTGIVAAAIPTLVCIFLITRRSIERAGMASLRGELERFESYRHALQTELDSMFRRTSSEALSSNSEHLLKLARESFERFQAVSDERLTASCGVVSGELKTLSSSLVSLSERRARIDGELVKQIDHLLKSSEEVTTETARLRKALTNPRGQGMWGEQQLRNLLKHAGMLEFADFCEQVHVVDSSDGRRVRPDVVVKLPNGYHIAIDSKAPLKALVESAGAEDRHLLLNEFRESLKRHIRELSNKRYDEKVESGAIQYTILFLPSDSLLTTVYESGEDLVAYARDMKILISTPSSLLVLLCSAAALWRDQALLENAKEIETLGKQLYQRLVTFSQSFGEIGNSLEKAVRTYNAAAGTLESRLLVSGRRFASLGVGDSDKLIAAPEINENLRELKNDARTSV